jgi:hypothetical protein
VTEIRSSAARPASGAGRAIRWILGLQVAIAILMMGGDLLRVAPTMLPRSPAPGLDLPVSPGDQTRRYTPRLAPGEAPSGPGFPGDGRVPRRLTWATAEIAGAPALLLTGAIAPGDAARFADHLDGLENRPDTVALHSPGGSVRDALEIGRRLRTEGLATRVGPDAACFSACPYILAGGVRRTVSRTAMVGVHQHYFGENAILPAFMAVEDIQSAQADVMTYLDEMGIDPLLMVKAMQTPPDDIYILVASELEGLALATELAD